MPTEEQAVDALLTGKADLNYTVAFEVIPPIKLADFKGFSVTKPVVDVSDADVDEAINRIVEPDKLSRSRIASLVNRGLSARRDVYVMAANNAEGCAPLTLQELAMAVAA